MFSARNLIILAILWLFSTANLSFAGSLDEAMQQSVSGMKVQGERIKIITQNIANASSTGQTPGALPYKRKLLIMNNKTDKHSGYNLVATKQIKEDKKTPFAKHFDPAHPAANSEGYVLTPNIDMSVENADMKEAERGYEANLGAAKVTNQMILNTIDLLN